jgi:hypothetical protein
MRLLISHFFNEEYLLPWWLSHHRDMFDHGVLIDYRSTDRSVEICREFVPRWDVVTSENKTFAALLVDFEVMKHEQRYPGAWKIALNTTEFLMAADLSLLEERLTEAGSTGGRLPGAMVVDTQPDSQPDKTIALTRQKQSGVWEGDARLPALGIPSLQHVWRSRLYHRYDIGAYMPGRHASHLPGIQIIEPRDAAIWWYGFAPWSDELKARKLQIDNQRDGFDRKHLLGWQHQSKLAELEHCRISLAAISGLLTDGLHQNAPHQSIPSPDALTPDDAGDALPVEADAPDIQNVQDAQEQPHETILVEEFIAPKVRLGVAPRLKRSCRKRVAELAAALQSARDFFRPRPPAQ